MSRSNVGVAIATTLRNVTLRAIGPRLRTVDLGPVEAVPVGRAHVLAVERRGLAVHRTRHGEVYATEAHCPSEGESLAGAVVGGRVVMCPGHGYAFNLRTGQCIGGSSASLRTYAACVSESGRILVVIDG